MTSNLIEYISNFISLEKTEIDAISAVIQIKDYKKGQILLKEGMVAQISYFNLKGCVRLFYLVDGEERTTFFYTENQFITSIRSFTQREPSNHYLECIEDCTLALIPYDIEKKLLHEFPKLETFSRKVLEQELGNYQDMLSNYIISNPEQRYLDLLKNKPQLLQRIPLYQLASYIGVKAESLSRIRNRVTKKTS
jgi:CRP-like cAMP-binding protein